MPTTTAPETMIDRIENASPLDPVVKTVRKIVNAALGPQQVRDALHGVWLGHPVHPVLTDVPIGVWTAAGVLDLLPGTGHASTTLIATGCAAAVPTAVTGGAARAQLHPPPPAGSARGAPGGVPAGVRGGGARGRAPPPQQRVGLVHAVSNIVGLGLMGASVLARLRGRTLRGKGLAYAGLTAVMAGGYLGGHLVFRQAAGANHTADVPDLFPSGWQDLGPLDDLPDAAPSKRTVDGVDLLVVRRGQHVDVLTNKCSHLSGPLSDGEFTVESGQGCIVCPWHGSTFRLSDGAAVHGPATSPQNPFETKIENGRVQVRLNAD